MGLLDGLFNRNCQQAPQDFPNYNLSGEEAKREIERLQKIIDAPKQAQEQRGDLVIDKRVAACEIIRVLFRLRTWALASAILLLAASGIGLLSWEIGAGVGVIGAGVAGYFYFMANKEIWYLKNKYGV